MSASAREFVFTVDTEEVLAAAPPSPVVALPRRRQAAGPTVVLRLPDARPAAPMIAPPTAPATAVQAIETPMRTMGAPAAQPAPMPALSLPMMPKPESADPVTSLDDLARASVAQLIPATATPPLAPSNEVEDAVTAAPETEVFWKTPKFMLAGIAAAFLGMVSLMAMNRQEQATTEEAPRWSHSRVAEQSVDRQEPLGEETPSFTPRVTTNAKEPWYTATGPYRAATTGGAGYPATSEAAQGRHTSSASAGAADANATAQFPWRDPQRASEPRYDLDDAGGEAVLSPNLYFPGAIEASQQGGSLDGGFSR